MGFGRAVWAIFWKDLRSELRRWELTAGLLIFPLLVAVLFGLAFDRPPAQPLAGLFPGLLWLAYLFGGTLGVQRSFAVERDEGALEGLLAAPAERSALFFGKLLGNFTLMGLVELVLTPIFFVLLRVPWNGSLPLFAAALLLGTLGFSAAATLLAALAAPLRAGELLLPVLLLPVLVPVVLAVVQLTGALLAGETGGLGPWFSLLGVYAAVFVALPSLLFDYVLEV